MRGSKALWMSLAVSTLLGVTNCSDPAGKAGDTAEACGKRSCPAGTRPEETRQLDASNDISGGYDPATYKAEGAYKTSGSGSCEYACVVTQACPEGTFPIITETCFTCGAVSDSGQIDQSACSDEGIVATECGKQTCPVGTGPVEGRKLTDAQGYDVSQGFDPSKFDSSLEAFMTFGEGECEFQCSPLSACPEHTFPIITADCFTCAYIDEQRGMVRDDAVCKWKDPHNTGGTGNTGGSTSGGAPSTEGGMPATTEGGAGGSEG